MNKAHTAFEQLDKQEIWLNYQHNMPRYLIGLARHLQEQTLRGLTVEGQHKGLQLSWEPYFTLVGQGSCRPTELARWLGISKQACNQNARQIEAAGYLTRLPDPLDGRARLFQLTASGRQLLEQGAELALQCDRYYASLLRGASLRSEVRTEESAALTDDWQRVLQLLRALYSALHLPSPHIELAGLPDPGLSAAYLPRLSQYVQLRLMDLTIAQGHTGLKMSHGQVLTLIGPQGGRMKDMSDINGVSKQAISAVANELSELGYIRRSHDTANRREVRLLLTAKGEALIRDSVRSVSILNEEFARLIGHQQREQLEQYLQALYNGLHLEAQVFGSQHSLQQLASQLKQQLDTEQRRELAALLLA